MKKLLMLAAVHDRAFSIGAKKLAHPRPRLSNFPSSRRNSGRPLPAQWKVPRPVLVEQRARPQALSVPLRPQDVVLRRRQHCFCHSPSCMADVRR
jgi:hypothetical protein